MAHNEQSETLRRQISDLERLMQHFDALREKVSDLVEKAAHDPAAAERLAKLEQAWKNDIQQKTEQMQQYMKEALRMGVQYQQVKRQLNNDTSGAESPVTVAAMVPPVPPAQKSRISIKKKTRCFA